jgi:V8-like Glu-specific endopeptidase
MTIRSAPLLLLLAACSTVAPTQGGSQPESGDTGSSPTPTPTTDGEVLEPRIAEQAALGHLIVDLGDGREDPSVIDDANALLGGALDGIVPLDFAAGHRITLVFLGKGAVGDPAETTDPGEEEGGAPPAEREPGAGLDGVDAFNLATRNEFQLVFSADLLEAIGVHAAANRLDLGSKGASQQEDIESSLTPGFAGMGAWSGGDDDRKQIYGDDGEVTFSTHQRLVQIGTGCSGTLVGPRHVVTAGHCLWSRTNQAWTNNVNIRAGANGTAEQTEVRLDTDDIPNGQAVWYYTPSQFRAPNGDTWGFDYGILTIPARLGDTVGWLGRVTYTADSLSEAYVLRRGYPACTATFGGLPRIDVPLPCMPNHLYGNAADCSTGEYESVDADGWSRVVHHSCDASGGDSGSGLYVYHGGVPAVAAVHFFSECERTAGDLACTGAWEDRPLGAIRLTPAYRDLIGAFRSIFP